MGKIETENHKNLHNQNEIELKRLNEPLSPIKYEDPPNIKNLQNPRNLYAVIFLGVLFMLLFSAFNSAQNMISQIYSQKLNLSYLGNLTLIVVYVVLGCSNIFISKIMDYLFFKSAMFLATWGYVGFLFAGAVACSCEDNPDRVFCSETALVIINVFFGIILGLLASILWVAQVGYVSALCDENSKAKYFGIFWALMLSSEFFGNVISAILLGYLSHFAYFIRLFFLSIVSALLFLLLPNVEKLPEQEIKKPLVEKIHDFFKYFKVKEMQIFSIFCIFSGNIIGFYTGFLYKIVKVSIETEDDNELNQKTAYVFICLGVFEFLGGMFNSYYGDKMNKYVMGTISTLLVEVALLFTMKAYTKKSYTLCFFASAGWGAGECICNSVINVILTTDLGNKIECFAVFKFAQGIGVLIALAFSVMLDGEDPFFYLIIMSFFQISATLSLVYLKNNVRKFE